MNKQVSAEQFLEKIFSKITMKMFVLQQQTFYTNLVLRNPRFSQIVSKIHMENVIYFLENKKILIMVYSQRKIIFVNKIVYYTLSKKYNITEEEAEIKIGQILEKYLQFKSFKIQISI